MDVARRQDSGSAPLTTAACTAFARRRSALACLALAGGLLATAAGAQTPPLAPASQGVFGALDHGLRPTTLAADAPLPGWSLRERMAFHHVPGVAIAVIRDGQVVQASGFGLREAGSNDAVDADTMFSVGSVSKVVTAATTLRQVAAGKLDLDRDVNSYLRSWKVPDAPAFSQDTLTLRMLMSHTSGLTVWGFEDYLPGAKLPTIVQTLDGVAPAKNDPVRIDFEPGSRMRYSGGGVTVEQLVLEDTTRKPLEAIARGAVFAPLAMRRSSYLNPLPATLGNIAKAHDKDGNLTALPRGWEAFPEQAASGLWTSANDLGAFVGALLRSYRGQDDFLPQSLAQQMMSEVSPSIHGLGPRLEGEGQTRIFHHGGSNDSYRAWIEGYLETGDGLVILTNGSNGSKLMMEIRNALSDALGRGVNPPLRTLALPPAAVSGFAGSYRLDTTVPKDLAGNLSGAFESDVLDVAVSDASVSVQDKGSPPMKLQALTPTRFIGPGDISQMRFEFVRDARGEVHSLMVARGNAQAWFRREPAQAATQ
ncbi:beta-lactamase family protein [Lysobacter sp. S4-A87]|uniref:serine hydrolase domain-containing protein n=1 Tax=Lysobacter sp. S4-A87 TaxID=2925843 RepID=UPI001F52F10A|nr:serine hydrolase domain-containing protein [Lysobacter sp. S4-A87]UNK48501.1 beta-lactamase family protein [Lysobacter sp. S4-A87]